MKRLIMYLIILFCFSFLLTQKSEAATTSGCYYNYDDLIDILCTNNWKVNLWDKDYTFTFSSSSYGPTLNSVVRISWIEEIIVGWEIWTKEYYVDLPYTTNNYGLVWIWNDDVVILNFIIYMDKYLLQWDPNTAIILDRDVVE